MPAALIDEIAAERSNVVGKITIDEILKLVPFYFDFGGQFLLDPNEFNGWGILGMHDNTNSQDLGNVGTEPNHLAGGPHRDFDFEVLSISGWIRENNNEITDPWGFRLFSQEKFDNSGDENVTDILNEVGDNGGVGPRDYTNTNPQWFSIDLSAVPTNVVPAGHVLGFGVESPQAVATNRYIQFMSGLIKCRRV